MKLPFAALLLLPCAVLATGRNDYAHGVELDAGDGKPLQEMQIPDEVYAGVLRPDLGDLRVFNAAGTAVPHALCGMAVPAAEMIERPLPAFPLRAAAAAAHAGDLHVEVQTADGAEVQISHGSPAVVPQPRTVAHVIDVRSLDLPLLAIRVAWESPDGASELRVRVEASEDLDQWREVVASTTLLRSSGPQAQTLERMRIPLPPARYTYLRLQRVEPGAPLRILATTAEARVPPPALVPLQFSTVPLAAEPATVARYDAGRQAPVSYARLQLPSINMSLRVALASRARPPTDKDQAWQPRWSGEATSVQVEAAVPDALPIRFEPTTDRYWQLQILEGAETLGGLKPQLQLAYLPGRLNFLAQGEGPYTLAYGSARVPASTPACGSLLTDVDAAERQRLTGMAYSRGSVITLGGSSMLKPVPRSTPMRVIALWVTLALGALALVVMALSLMKRLRQPPDDPAA
ncbi:MAG TPA: DUF3999 domain-containing protein [Solimonas sp.]|nr:DUF3999 domain-containing protein [Solimonas sp.]